MWTRTRSWYLTWVHPWCRDGAINCVHQWCRDGIPNLKHPWYQDDAPHWVHPWCRKNAPNWVHQQLHSRRSWDVFRLVLKQQTLPTGHQGVSYRRQQQTLPTGHQSVSYRQQQQRLPTRPPKRQLSSAAADTAHYRPPKRPAKSSGNWSHSSENNQQHLAMLI